MTAPKDVKTPPATGDYRVAGDMLTVRHGPGHVARYAYNALVKLTEEAAAPLLHKGAIVKHDPKVARVARTTPAQLMTNSGADDDPVETPTEDVQPLDPGKGDQGK